PRRQLRGALREQLAGGEIRAAQLLSSLRRSVHPGLNPMRPVLEPRVVIVLSRSSRTCRRRNDPGSPIHLGRYIPAGEARTGLRALRHRRRRRAHRGAYARRLSSDNYSWHWCFLINGPIGVILFVLTYVFIPETPKARAHRIETGRRAPPFDLVGFLLVTTFLGSLEVVLDKGQEDDWFGSSFIVLFASLSVGALLLFVPWALLRRNPVIDVRMLASRQFGACFIVM